MIQKNAENTWYENEAVVHKKSKKQIKRRYRKKRINDNYNKNKMIKI